MKTAFQETLHAKFKMKDREGAFLQNLTKQTESAAMIAVL